MIRDVFEKLPGASVSVLDRQLRQVLVEGEAIRAAGFDLTSWEGGAVADLMGPAEKVAGPEGEGAGPGLPRCGAPGNGSTSRTR